MPKLTINGESREICDVMVLSDLLSMLKLNSAYLAVAIDDRVIPKSEHSSTTVKGGERIEVIHAVGGG